MRDSLLKTASAGRMRCVTAQRRASVILSDLRLTRLPSPGSQLIIRREPTTLLVYTIVDADDRRPEGHPDYERQKRHIDEQFSLSATFITHAQALQRRAKGAAGI